MAGGTGVIRDGGGKADGRQASVSNGNLHVQGDVGVVGPVALVEPVSVDDNGGSLTVDFTRPVPVTDNGGSLTVDGAVIIQEPLSVDDNGGSLTVDGAVTIQEPLSVDDNGASLTVDAPAATPVAVRLFDGAAAALGTLANPVYILDAVEVFPLSASVNGRPISLGAAGVFVGLHTVPALMRDVLTIYASNLSTVDHTMTLRPGGAAGDHMEVFLPAGETVVVLHEIPLDATVFVDAAISVAGTVRVVGRVRRRVA